VDADSALQLAKTAVAVGHAVLRPGAQHQTKT
jgi:hypothetical protein